ncbi:MAG: hypothetical protein IPP71_01610 [Bacteroidetes bacterium]|nr:hypothetical protein [Bacteroidota bacterium]
MNRTKKILLLVVSVFAGLFLAGNLLAYIYRDKVKKIVVASINENLKVKIEVGEISFSFIRNFPYATIDFETVKVDEPKEFSANGTVMNAGRLSLLFNLTSIFSEHYRLKKIVVANAALNLQIDKDGNANYEIWKDQSNNADTGSFKLELEDVEFENVNVLYYNVAKEQDISFQVVKGNLRGDFGKNQFQLTTSGSLQDASVLLADLTYLSKATCQLQLSLNVDKTKGLYTFNESTLQLSKLTLNLTGTLLNPKDFVEVDLQISSPTADLPALLSLIPEKYKASTKGYNYSGSIEFKGAVKGRSDKTHSPLVTFSFNSRDVSLNPKDSPYHLRKMNCNGFFTNRKNKAFPVTYLKLQNFKAELEGKPVAASIEIENFNKPKINVEASLEADLKAMSRFFKPDTLEEISGSMKINARFYGIAGEKATYKSSGDISVSNVDFRIKQKPTPFKIKSALFHLDGNDLLVQELYGSAGKSDFNVTGNFQNLFAWLFSDIQKLAVTASVQSNFLDLDELMAKERSVSNTQDTVYRLRLSEKLQLQVELDVRSFKFRKFQATALTGSVKLENRLLTTPELNLETVNGNVKLKGSIDNRSGDSLRIEYDAIVNGLDINKLFYEMGNFGQQMIVDKNLKGTVSAVVKFKSSWSDKLVLNENSIYAKSEITIENGELIDFEPVLALSKFLKGSDLKNIKFSTLTNTIEIKNRRIYIPLMEIKSTALDLTTSGEHTFDNVVNYKLQLYLSQIMGRKVRAQNSEFGTIEDDGLGRPKVFLSMKETLQPQIHLGSEFGREKNYR